jgi:hypothetical protein
MSILFLGGRKMNKALLLSALMFLFIVQAAFAAPTIENVTISPSDNIWLGESATITLNCYDTNSIEDVHADIVGPSIVLPTLFFSKNGDTYTLTVNKDYLDRTGQFDATIYCRNSINETNTTAKSFFVSNLTSTINTIAPSPSYVGETMEIDVAVRKNGIELSSGVVFNVSLNGQPKSLKMMPAYDSSKGWILKIDSPTTNGIYEVEVDAYYDRTSTTSYGSADVRNDVEFSITNIDKKGIKAEDNITVTLSALERGSVIELNEDNVDISINSVDAEITSVSRRDNLFDVKIVAPSLSSGSYQLEAYLTSKGSVYSDSEPIDYIVTIEGSITDPDNRALSTQIKFIQSGATKLTLYTDAYGYYSGSIPPGTYDLDISFPNSELYLHDVVISTFNDPIRYFYGDDFDVSGIRNAGLYDYELDLSFSNVELEMKYNEKNVIDESNLRIFKCSDWNSGNKICNDGWVEVSGELDTIRNSMRMTSTTLSAFIIGELKNLFVDFGPDNDEYYIGDSVKIRGIVKDSDGNSVGNASISVQIKNTQIKYNTVADSNGVFSIEMPPVDEEGEYVVTLTAKKSPFIDFKGEESFSVTKKRSIFIDFPETIRIERGSNLTQEFDLVNNGQADISNIEISLEGLPQGYYDISSNNIDLKSEQSKILYVDFYIPVYADVGISSATLKIESGNVSEEKVFGVNILEKGEGENNAPTGLATGFNLPEISYSDIMYIAIFATACFSVAIILKKLRVRGGKRNDIKKSLFNLKSRMSGEVGREVRNQKTDKPYDKLIITEFPNVLKFSKDIKRTNNKGDEKW